MDTLLDVGVGILRLIPLILILYLPALLGIATWSERGEGYRIKALLWFAIGFGAVVALHVMMRSDSAVQTAAVFGASDGLPARRLAAVQGAFDLALVGVQGVEGHIGFGMLVGLLTDLVQVIRL
jgi:hypothetical protein